MVNDVKTKQVIADNAKLSSTLGIAKSLKTKPKSIATPPPKAKIEEKSERNRLKGIISNLSLREGMGVIIRTAGQNKPERFFNRDLNLLLQQWDEIEAKMKSQDSPAFLYEESDLI